MEARCAAAEAAQADATRSSLDLRARAAQAEARAVHRVTATDDDAKALAQAVLARMDKIQTMATSDDSSEALQTLEKRATELETALTDAQRRLNDESTARANAERRAGREASSRADMEVEVALTQRLFLTFSGIQVRVDGVGATPRHRRDAFLGSRQVS